MSTTPDSSRDPSAPPSTTPVPAPAPTPEPGDTADPLFDSGEFERRRRWSPGTLAVQLVGLAIGIGLLVWAFSLSARPENRRSIEAMQNAPASEVGLLLALTFVSLVLNGLMFWVTLRPLKRLKPIDVVLVNSIATFFSVLPFKLSLVARVLIHHRRDGVSFKTLLAWVAAMGALGLAVLLPLVGATLWRGQLDALWWAASLAGLLAFNGLGVVLGHQARRVKLLRTLSFGADAIVRHVPAVVGHGVFRLADVGALAARFMAAAAIADVAMPIDQAVLLASVYFVLSVITPAGTLGFREMGVAALGLSQGLGPEQVALVALVVTGAEVVTSGGLATIAFIVLRPDKLVHRAGRAKAVTAAPPA